MITVEQIAQIRHAYYNEGRSIRWIAREYHHSREKVRQALDNPEPRNYTRTKAKPAPVMDPWKPHIDMLLIESDRLPRKHRYTAQRIYSLLYADGYRGCVGGVRNYVARKRGTSQQRSRVEVYLPLEFEPGRDAQADWGEALVELNGEQRAVQVFALRLCYSRVTFLCAYPTQRQECLFDGHVRAFSFFGGLPHRISYDNLTTAVQAILAGQSRREQQTFTQLRSYYLFESHFCTPGEGHEKGQIEHAVGYGRRNFMTPLLKADSFEGLNAQLQLACQNDLQRTVEGQTGSIYEHWLRERPQLRPLPVRPFACCITTQATLTPYSQVVFETNRYSVPADQAQRVLTVRAFPFTVEVIDAGSGRVLASHARCYERDQDVCEPQHYLALLEQRPGAFEHAKPIRQWRATWPAAYDELLGQLQSNQPGGAGVREFVRILKLHASHPASQIEQAVKEALAHRCPSYDSVRLCLHHVQSPDYPVAPLDLTQQPTLATSSWNGVQAADLQRYEALLTPEVVG